MFDDVQAAVISRFHDACFSASDWAKTGPVRHEQGVWKFIESNHRCNTLLWEEEDQARRTNVEDDQIAGNKRAIDRYNQRRQDAIEKIDESLLQRLAHVTQASHARQNSETAGSMIDRLSILSLKIFHMLLQTQRVDVDPMHIESCRQKLATLCEQRSDLLRCFDEMLAGAKLGVIYFKVYRQFKMYNDPTLNPYLYGSGGKDT